MCKPLLASVNSPRLCGHSVSLVFYCDSRVVYSLFSIPPKNLGDPGSSRGTLERIRVGLTIYCTRCTIYWILRTRMSFVRNFFTFRSSGNSRFLLWRDWLEYIGENNNIVWYAYSPLYVKNVNWLIKVHISALSLQRQRRHSIIAGGLKRSFKLVRMESTAPCNSLIGHSLKWRCCSFSLVWQFESYLTNGETYINGLRYQEPFANMLCGMLLLNALCKQFIQNRSFLVQSSGCSI